MKINSQTPVVINMLGYNIKTFVSTTQGKIDWYFNEFKTQPDKKFGNGAGKVILCDFLLNTIQNEDAYFSIDILNAEKSPTRWDEFLEDCVAFACLNSFLNNTALPIADNQLATMLNFLGATGKVNSIASAIH
jgi:hypothetical protein